MKNIGISPSFRWIVAWLAFLCAPAVHASEHNVKNVLLLHSYHHGFKWTDSITGGCESVLGGRTPPVHLRIEYMDARHENNPAYSRLLYESYRRRFAGTRFDLILSADTEAFEFLRKYRDALFPGVPVVFCGVNDFSDSLLDGRADITGVAESLDVVGTIDAALNVLPDTKQVFVFTDNTAEGKANLRVTNRALVAFNNRVRGSFIECRSMRDLLEKGFCMPPGSILLMMAVPCDECGSLSGENLGNLSEKCNVPIYGVWDFLVGQGIVGGRITDGFSQGKTAAEVALRILDGEKAGSIPVLKGTPTPYMFDYRQMRRFDIGRAALPHGSILINAPYYLNRPDAVYVWGVLLTVGFLSSAVVVLFMNVRKRRRAEEAAIRTTLQLDTLIQALPDMVFFKDTEGRHLAVNKACEKLIGRSQDEILGKTDRELLPPDFAEHCWRSDQEVLRKGEVLHTEERSEGSGGKPAYYDTIKAPIYDGKGALLGLVGVSRDVTMRKRGELALRESEARYRSVVETSPDGIVQFDLEGRILMMNGQCARMIGYESAGGMLGRTIFEFIVPEEHERVAADLLRIREAGTIPHVRYLLVRRDGSRFPTETSATVVSGGGRKPDSVMAMVRDVSEKTSLEKQLFQAMKMEAIGRLAGGLAHDINNYLGAITGFSDLVKITHGKDPALVRRMDLIAETVVRASSLIRQLLAFSRRQPSAPEVLDLNTMITGMESMMRRLIGEDVKLSTRLAGNLRKVKADPSQIEQVLANLLVNARDAMPDGGELLIETANADFHDGEPGIPDYMTPGNYTMLAVADTGTGVPDEIREKIFEPFFTTKETGKGSGLGLATVYGIVKQHGGYIQVRNHAPKGATFTIYFPECFDAAGSAAASSELPLQPGRGSERILLVEDNEDVRESTSALLDALGYRVETASNGEEALRILDGRSSEIDLLITDVVMPGIGGKLLADRASAMKENMKILFISGYPEEVIAVRGILSEGIHYLQKPFSAKNLSAKIRHMFGLPPA